MATIHSIEPLSGTVRTLHRYRKGSTAFKMPHSEAVATIPVIDISKPNDDTAREVLEAASTHGFLFIKNDGLTIPPKDIDDMFKLVSTLR